MSGPDTLWPRAIAAPRPFDNLALKLIALLLALGLWSLVPDNSVPHVVRDVSVLLGNIPAELALSAPFSASVDVSVRGTVTRTRDLFPGELSPTIDMFGAFAGENVITLTPDIIRAPLGVTVESIEPAQLRVVLEERIRGEVPVNPVVEGNPADGYELYDAVVEPAIVRVSGPRSAIENLQAVSTEVISVAGHRETLARDVGVTTENPVVTVEGPARVRLTLRIEEVAVTEQLEGVRIVVVNGRGRVAVNPESIGVVLRGPRSVLAELSAEDVRATVDVGALAPRSEDYRVEPRVEIVRADLAGRIEIIALTPQRRVDVHVFER